MCNFLIKPNVMGRELWVFWCLFNLSSADPQASKQLVRQERFYLGWQRPKVILATSQSDFVIFVPLSGQG